MESALPELLQRGAFVEREFRDVETADLGKS